MGTVLVMGCWYMVKVHTLFKKLALFWWKYVSGGLIYFHKSGMWRAKKTHLEGTYARRLR
jgi:hypothetical protein